MYRSPEQQRNIRDVATAIDLEPERWQQQYMSCVKREQSVDDGVIYPGDDAWCDTAFCIAGWNWVLHRMTDLDGLILFSHAPYANVLDEVYAGTSFANADQDDVMYGGSEDFGLTEDEQVLLFGPYWTPNQPVGDALRQIADGWPVAAVTDYDAIHDAESREYR